jgi:hypothetical protein
MGISVLVVVVLVLGFMEQRCNEVEDSVLHISNSSR